MNNNTYSITVSVDDEATRIDKWLSHKFPEISRSYLQTLISQDNVLVNNYSIKANYKLKESDQVTIIIPIAKATETLAEQIKLDVIYEDSSLIVVNKERGMVVHPAHGNESGTLVNALLYHCQDLSGIGGEIRPGIVHRIDKDTTGLLVVAKNDSVHNHLAQQFKEHTIHRAYVALVHGLVEEQSGTIDAPIGRHPNDRKKMAVVADGGRKAITHFNVLQRYESGFSLLNLRLETGRTHQIRVHLAYIGFPVAADSIYGYRKSIKLAGQALHAGELGFVHPKTGEEMKFYAEIPQDFKNVLQVL